MKTILTSIFFIAVGIFFLVQSLMYNLGTLTNMGPGFFPAMFSIAIIVLGLAIGLEVFKRGHH